MSRRAGPHKVGRHTHTFSPERPSRATEGPHVEEPGRESRGHHRCFTVQKALPLFTDGGSIILNASIVASKGLEAISVYSASKAAVRSFARCWTTDLRHRKIRVNTISPGPIETSIFHKVGLTREQADEAKKGLVAAVPLGRMGTPDEVANAAVFLASDDSSYVTGVELFVDGGMAQV
jgi:NAD(P)-dependent dehydrogenase (short-subunit alcohol dehydrogenase family)